MQASQVVQILTTENLHSINVFLIIGADLQEERPLPANIECSTFYNRYYMKKLILIFCLSLSSVFAFPQWDSIPSGTSSNLVSVFFPDHNIGYVVGEHGDSGVVLKTSDGGNYWSTLENGTLGPLSSVYFFNKDTGFATCYYSGILKTTNGGITWNACTVNSINGLNSICFVNSSIGYAAGDVGTIVKTVDGGSTWNALSSGTSYALNSICFPNANIGYAATMGGFVLKTIDGGSTWLLLQTLTTGWINAVYFGDTLTGYAVTGHAMPYGGYIFKTIDGGLTWNLVFTVNNILNSIYFPNPNVGYAIGQNGLIVKTNDTGSTWNALSSGTSESLNSLFFNDPDTGYVVGANGIILKTTNGGIVSIENKVPINHMFSIYPNPASDKITVETTGETQESYLAIVNIEGQQLLTSQITQPKTQLDISSLPSGVYFVRLTDDRTVEVRKFVKE